MKLLAVALLFLLVVSLGCVDQGGSVPSEVQEGGMGEQTNQHVGNNEDYSPATPPRETGGSSLGNSEEADADTSEGASDKGTADDVVATLREAVLSGSVVVCDGSVRYENSTDGRVLGEARFKVYYGPNGNQRTDYLTMTGEVFGVNITEPTTLFLRKGNKVYVNIQANPIHAGKTSCVWLVSEQTQTQYSVDVKEDTPVDERDVTATYTIGDVKYYYSYKCDLYSGPDPFVVQGKACTMQELIQDRMASGG